MAETTIKALETNSSGLTPVRSVDHEMEEDIHCSLFIVHLSFVIASRSSRLTPNEHWAISGR
jgi:hypothetical protein